METLVRKTIVIVGPTASGKSDLAIALAHKYNGEIISADSRQVYRGMDIGTGKVMKDLPVISNPSAERAGFQPVCRTGRFPISKKIKNNKSKNPQQEKSTYLSEGIIHHLIDVASPKRTYNVTHFIRDTKKAITDIRKREKVPIICGGTGFWVQSFIDGNNFPLVKPDAKLRKKLEKLSVEKLFSMLEKKDPRRAETIDAQNKVRLIRALEICKSLGIVPISHQSSLINYQNFCVIALCPNKKILDKNIEIRLEKRLKQGMVAEVKKLRESGLSWKRLESFGLEYKYVVLFLQKKITKAEMKERLNFEIRHYAKRQITWLKRFEKMGATIHWITKPTEAMRIIKKL